MLAEKRLISDEFEYATMGNRISRNANGNTGFGEVSSSPVKKDDVIKRRCSQTVCRNYGLLEEMINSFEGEAFLIKFFYADGIVFETVMGEKMMSCRKDSNHS
jgi:hypothetical protein